MAFDCSSNYRKPLLFSDLFKSNRSTAVEKERQDAAAVFASSSSPSSSSTQFLSSSWDSSSSSGFSTPPRSDFGSSEGDDADFTAELTRQMAECMLEEEESSAAGSVYEAISYGNSAAAVGSLGSELYSKPVRVDDPTQPSVHVYEVKNQPPVSNESSTRGRRLRRSESAQQKPVQKTEQQFKQYRGGMEWGGVGRNGYTGSGMQAVFIGGSGSRSGVNGTGVFLPRDPTEQQKNKPGCSIVLMPTRVLQVLEQHFSRVQQDSSAPTPVCGGSPAATDGDESTVSSGPGVESLEPEIQSVDEMQLPQEWTY